LKSLKEGGRTVSPEEKDRVRYLKFYCPENRKQGEIENRKIGGDISSFTVSREYKNRGRYLKLYCVPRIKK
jgi:hypothetical protein